MWHPLGLETMRKHVATWLCLFFLFSSLLNAPLWARSRPFQWADLYTPITDKSAWHILNDGIATAQKFFGDARYPLQQVKLKLSQPLNAQAMLKKDFQLTEVNDLTQGHFTIYLNKEIHETAFTGQLMHEIGHLLDPTIHDAYYEGLCSVFAENYLKDNNFDWKSWQDYYNQGHEPFYGQTYFMMKEIANTIGFDALKNFHLFTKPHPKKSHQTYIDIQHWIQSLEPSQQIAVRSIIAKYSTPIQLSMQASQHAVMFVLPH